MCPTLPYNPQTGYLTFLEGGEPFKQRKQQEEEEGCEVVEVRRGPEQVRVTQGLTTAAAVWMSAALGVTAATGVSNHSHIQCLLRRRAAPVTSPPLRRWQRQHATTDHATTDHAAHSATTPLQPPQLPVLTAVGTGLTIVILRLNSITRIAMPMKYAKNRF
mmetsp:Transcript_55948/g.154243  ORF Transcript_55948/g.154243 Transcript_55948/m.154243 type:complete len:161 (+) Transcript_55948:844-1326(+)